MKDLKLIFSLMTGEVYTVEEDEVKNLDQHQVPLKKPFPKNCKKCYGRGYIGYQCKKTKGGIIPTAHLALCMSCLSKCADLPR